MAGAAVGRQMWRRKQAKVMEMEAARFYSRAVSRITDAPTRELLNKLADEERKHEATADGLEEKHLTEPARAQEDESHRKLILLQIVQPGLLGLMDGSDLNACAALCGSIRNTQELGRIFGWSWRRRLALAFRWHFRKT